MRSYLYARIHLVFSGSGLFEVGTENLNFQVRHQWSLKTIPRHSLRRVWLSDHLKARQHQVLPRRQNICRTHRPLSGVKRRRSSGVDAYAVGGLPLPFAGHAWHPCGKGSPYRLDQVPPAASPLSMIPQDPEAQLDVSAAFACTVRSLIHSFVHTTSLGRH